MWRKIYILSFFTLIVLSASAQNWKPFYLGDTANYKFGNGTEYLINTLWVDSAKVVNGDSVFYMNRIVTDCDTCIHILPQCDTCYALTNQPQFLMRTIIKKPNSYYQLEDTSTYYIKTNAVLNESWIFDSVHNITATVTDYGIGIISTRTDSIKTISLSNGYNFKLSKTLGIISFPDFNGSGIENYLMGIENRMFGYRIPNYIDYYNFNIGEMLIYEGYLSSFNGIQWGSKNYTIYKTITSKTISQDKIQYNYDFLENWTGFPGGQGTNTGSNCFEIASSHYSNLYNNQFTIENRFYDCQGYSDFYTKAVVTNMRKYVNQLYYPYSTNSVIFVKPSYGETGSDYFSITKLNGGESSHQDYGFEYQYDYHLIAYSLVGIKPDIPIINNVSLSPNPASGFVAFKTTNDIAEKDYNIEIFDLQGNVILRQLNIKTTETILNISSLSPGLYLYNAYDNNKNIIGKGKLVVQ